MEGVDKVLRAPMFLPYLLLLLILLWQQQNVILPVICIDKYSTLLLHLVHITVKYDIIL